jgi:hypothetical protein
VAITIAVAAFGYLSAVGVAGTYPPASWCGASSWFAHRTHGVGLLIYKSNKVINFAGRPGAVPECGVVDLARAVVVLDRPVAGSSVALGSFVEFVIIRRSPGAPPTPVVTVGLAQLLAGLGVAILLGDLPQQTYNPPSTSASRSAGHLRQRPHRGSRRHLDRQTLRSSASPASHRAAGSSELGPASLLGVNVGFTTNRLGVAPCSRPSR